MTRSSQSLASSNSFLQMGKALTVFWEGGLIALVKPVDNGPDVKCILVVVLLGGDTVRTSDATTQRFLNNQK